MSITVARVENLFWNNNSYKKPNALPVFVESEVVKRRPVIYDFMGGRTHLIGDKWNYAIYEGVYYFLKIDKTYDVRKKHYSYVMIRDIWMNIIIKNIVNVRGRLTCTARDEWISANLNRTFPVLDDPVKVTRITLGGESFTLSKHVSIRPAVKGLPVVLLSNSEIESFKKYFSEAAKTYKVQIDSANKFFKDKKSPIFIFDILRGFETHTYSWKENLKNRVNSFIRELKALKDKKGREEDIVISRVGEGLSSILKDKYCVTWKTGGIGTAKETIKLHEIDLSGLEDIVQLNISSLKEFTKEEILAQPYMKRIREDLFKHFYDFKYQGPKTYKIRRKIYFPMTTTTSSCGMAIAKREADNKIDMAKVNWTSMCPQKLSTRWGSIFLTFINDINFTLSYNRRLWTTGGGGPTVSVTIHYYPESSIFKENPAIAWTYPHHSYNDITDWHFYDRDSDLFTPMGFLMFGFFNYKTFDGFKCKADGELGKIQYISGLKNSQLYKISDGSFFKEYKTKLYELPYKIGSRFTYSPYISPSRNWQRYWHNIINGLDMIFLPNGKGYEYAWRAWNQDDKLSNQYQIRALQTDQEAWNPLGAPFKDRAAHEASILRSYELIDNVAMKTIVEMPLTIRAGDYLFTDMEYWMGTFDTKLLATTGYQVKNSDIRRHYYMAQNLILEDFLQQPENIVENNSGIAIISTLEGKIELRRLDTFALTHRLHGPTYSEAQIGNPIFLQTAFDSFSKEVKEGFSAPDDFLTDEQAVLSVEGATSKRVGYLALRMIEDGELPSLEPMNKKLLNKAIYEFLKTSGYVVSKPTVLENDFVANVLLLEDSDFDGENPMLFDLKGTDWYAYIRRGKISLIAKSVEIFDKTTDQIMAIPKEEKLEQLSPLEKVNQKCVLTVRTHERKLKTRFKFDGDNIDLTVSNIVTTKNSVTDYFFLALRGDFDVIEKDIISVPKSQLDAAEVVNHLELEALRVQMLRNDRNFQTAMERDIDLGREKLTEEYRHQAKQLDIERMKTWADSILNPLQAASGIPAALIMQDYVAAGRAAWGVGRSMVNSAFKHLEVREKIQHMEKEKEFSFRNLAYNTLKVVLTHRDLEEDSIRRINQVAHVYRKGTVNDTDLMKEFRKETDGLEADKEIFLTVFTPSGEQLRLLEAHREEYGVDCDIPTAIITIKDGMDAEIIKFKNLTNDGVIGLENLDEREYLMASLEMGIKIVNITSNPPDERSQYVCTNIFGLSRELAQKREEYLVDPQRLKGLEDLNKALRAEVEQAKEALEDLKTKKQELEAQAAELNKNIEKLQTDLANAQAETDASKAKLDELKAKKQELEEAAAAHQQNIEKLQADLNKSKEELDKSKADLQKALADKDDQKRKLDAEIKRHRDDLREAEQKWDNCKRDYDNERDAHNRLAKEKENLDKRIKEMDDRIKELEEAAKNVPVVDEQARCDVIKKVVRNSYEMNLGRGDFLWPNNLGGLAQWLATKLIYIRKAGLDQSLTKFQPMRKLLSLIEELEGIPLIDKMMDFLRDDNLTKFLDYKMRIRQYDASLAHLVELTNTISTTLSTRGIGFAIKETLGEIIWRASLAYSELKEAVKDDLDLQTFFAHLFPGKMLNDDDSYEKIFGEPLNVPLVRKAFKCVENTDPVATLKELLEKEWFEGLVSRVHDVTIGRPPTKVVDDEFTIDPAKIAPYMFPSQIHYSKGWAIWEISRFSGKYKHPDVENIFYSRATVMFRSIAPYTKKLDHWIGLRMERNTFERVNRGRQKLWEGRRKITLSDEVMEKLKGFNWDGYVLLGTMLPKPIEDKNNTLEFTTSVKECNLKKIFGHKLVDALIFIAIMFFKNFKWRRELSSGYKGMGFDCWYIAPVDVFEAPIDDFIAAIVGVRTERPAYWAPSYTRRTPLDIIKRWSNNQLLGEQEWERKSPIRSYQVPKIEKVGSSFKITLGVEFANAESLINYIYSVVDSGEFKESTSYSDAGRIKALKDEMAKL